MTKEFDIKTLKQFIIDGKFQNGDKIYCKQYPNLIFIYENNSENKSEIDNFIAYYMDGHDLYSDGALSEIIKNDDCTFSVEPFGNLF